MSDVKESIDLDELVQPSEPEIEFQDSGDNDDDVLIVPPGGEAPVEEDANEDGAKVEPQVQPASPGLDQNAISQAFRDGFAELGKNLSSREDGNKQPVQQPGESDADFRKRFEKELFYSKGKAYDAIKEAVQREVGPILANIQQQTASLTEQSFGNDPTRKKYYTKYKDEIRGWIKRNIPPANQNDPRALEMAYNSVIAGHQSDIIEMEVQARLDEANAKTKPKPVYQSGSSGQTKKKKRVVKMTTQDVARMRSLGLDEKTYVKYYK